MKRKYYVVWTGRAPGIYDTWEECKAQVEGFPGARYRAYTDLEEATESFREFGDGDDLALFRNMPKQKVPVDYSRFPEIRLDALAVDAACSSNPGPVEYQGVIVGTGKKIFKVGPLPGGTNNIGEFLAIIHAAALLKQQGFGHLPIYTDSRTAMSWLRNGHSKTTLTANADNAEIMAMLTRADRWLATNVITNPIMKWDTEKWGEIPADFGRK